MNSEFNQNNFCIVCKKFQNNQEEFYFMSEYFDEIWCCSEECKSKGENLILEIMIEKYEYLINKIEEEKNPEEKIIIQRKCDYLFNIIFSKLM